MGILQYGLTVSLDGYVNDADGGLDWAAPDSETHRFVNDLESKVDIYLFGRTMWETMRVWDDEEALVGFPDDALAYRPVWQAAEKVVYSTSLDDPGIQGVQLRRHLDLDEVRAWKETTAGRLAVGGPGLAAQLLRAGLVDELTIRLAPVMIGAGTPFLPPGLQVELDLLEERRLGARTVFLRYAVRG